MKNLTVFLLLSTFISNSLFARDVVYWHRDENNGGIKEQVKLTSAKDPSKFQITTVNGDISTHSTNDLVVAMNKLHAKAQDADVRSRVALLSAIPPLWLGPLGGVVGSYVGMGCFLTSTGVAVTHIKNCETAKHATHMGKVSLNNQDSTYYPNTRGDLKEVHVSGEPDFIEINRALTLLREELNSLTDADRKNYELAQEKTLPTGYGQVDDEFEGWPVSSGSGQKIHTLTNNLGF